MTVENEWFTIIALSAAQLTITYQLSPTILYNSHCSLIGRAYHAGIRLQALRYITVTSDRSHRTGRQFFIRQSHVNLPGRNIDFDNVSVYNFSDIASSCRFRRNMSDTQSGSSTTETSVGNQSDNTCQSPRGGSAFPPSEVSAYFHSYPRRASASHRLSHPSL